VEVESISLIQKAQELHKASAKPKEGVLRKPPRKHAKTPKVSESQPLSLAVRAARINNELGFELPAIEEAFDKENDTFA